MKRILVWPVILLLLFIYSRANAQFYYYNDRYYERSVVFEFGTAAGIMNCLTDLGGKKGPGKRFIKDLEWKNSLPCFSIYALATYRYAVGLKLELNLGAVQATDSTLKDIASSTLGRYERNLSFKSRIREVQLSFECHPLFFRNFENDPPRISPYLLVGIGWFSFDPKTKLDGQWYALQPLRTEGQGFPEYPGRMPYKLEQFNFPTGIGIRYEWNPLMNARLELVYRFLQTDYLDDASTNYIDPHFFAQYLSAGQAAIAQLLYHRQASLNSLYHPEVGPQRGNSANKDAYFSFQFKLGIRLIHRRR